MNAIVGRSLQELFHEVLERIFEDGEDVTVRGLKTLELHPCLMKIIHPEKRTLLYPKRGNNPFATLAETLWVLCGRNDMAFLEKFLPRCKDFSDNGEVWRGGYGPRLFDHSGIDDNGNVCRVNQLDYVLKTLNKDIYSRQAIMTIWDPNKENTVEQTKDYPCTSWLHFLYRNDALDLTVVMRSNDALWGMCLSGETKIKLLDGTVQPIKDLIGKQFYVYSKDENGRIVPGKVLECAKTGYKKLIKIKFTDGTFVRCTPEHKILMKDGNYKIAKDLIKNDSIDSLYFRYDKSGYEEFNNGDGNWIYTHRMSAAENFTDDLSKDDSYHVIHHKDFNKKNNNPDNLKKMGNHTHIKYHADLASSEYMQEAQRKGLENRWNKEENHTKQSELLKKLWQNPDYRESRKEIIKNFTENAKIRPCSAWRSKVISENITKAHKEGKYKTEKFVNAQKTKMIDYNKSKIGREKSKETIQKTKPWEFVSLESKQKSIERIHQSGILKTQEIKDKIRKTKILQIFKQLELNDLIFCEPNYRLYWKYGCPGWKKVFNYFSNLEEIKECLKTFNHTIESIEECDYEDVYDLQVENYHNFVLENGVIVHNSSINVYEFTVLQEIVAALLGVKVGHYYHLSDSLHVYEYLGQKNNFKAIKELRKSYIDLESPIDIDGKLCVLPVFKFAEGVEKDDMKDYFNVISRVLLYLEDPSYTHLFPRKYRSISEVRVLLDYYLSRETYSWESALRELRFSDLVIACDYWVQKNMFKKKDTGAELINECINHCKVVCKK